MPFDSYEIKAENPDRPPIYITSPDQQHHHNQGGFTQLLYPTQANMAAAAAAAAAAAGAVGHAHRPMMPLTVQTQNLLSNPHQHHHQPPLSPNSLANYNQAINTPLPPSPAPGSPMSMSAVSQEGDDGANSAGASPNNQGQHADYGDNEGLFDM